MEKNTVTELGQDLQQYVKVQMDLLRLQTVNKIAGAASSIFVALVIALIAFLCILFFSITLGLYLSELLESYTMGFLIVGLILMFILMLLILFSRPLLGQPIKNSIIVGVLDKIEDEDEDEDED